MNFELLSIHFAAWQNLYASIAIGLIVTALLSIKLYKTQQAFRLLCALKFRSLMFVHGSLMRRWIKYGLLLVGFAALLIALLEPQWHKKQQEVEQKGRDLLIAVDIFSGDLLGCFD